MVTKTQSVIDNMNYFLTSKESGGIPVGLSTDIYRDICDIFGNQVKNGLKTPEEIENFRNTLPGTEAIFNKSELHSGLSILQPRFEELVRVSEAEQQIDIHAKVA